MATDTTTTDRVIRDLEVGLVTGLLVGGVEYWVDGKEERNMGAAKSGAVAAVSSFAVHEVTSLLDISLFKDNKMAEDLTSSLLVGLIYAGAEKVMKSHSFGRHLITCAIADFVSQYGVDALMNLWKVYDAPPGQHWNKTTHKYEPDL